MNNEEYIDSRNVDAVRKALINTEKGLKEAVTMLRSDMVDIVARICISATIFVAVDVAIHAIRRADKAGSIIDSC